MSKFSLFLSGIHENVELHAKVQPLQEPGNHHERTKPVTAEETSQVRIGVPSQSLPGNRRGGQVVDSKFGGQI